MYGAKPEELRDAADHGVAYVQFERLPDCRLKLKVHFDKSVRQSNLAWYLRQFWADYGWEITHDGKTEQRRGLLEPTSIAIYLTRPYRRRQQYVLGAKQFSKLSSSIFASRTSLSTVSITPVLSNGTCLIRFTAHEGTLPDFENIVLRSRELRDARTCPYGADSSLDKVFRVHLAAGDKKLPRVITAIALECRTWPLTAQLVTD